MTTIAYDGTMLAWDSLMSDGEIKMTAPPKVTIDKGRIYAQAGEYDACVGAIQWLRKGGKISDYAKYVTSNGKFELLVFDHKKGLTYYSDNDRYGIPTPMNEPNALGTGKHLALGALGAGKSAAEAVRIAAMYDVYTGGQINFLDVRATLEKTAPKQKTKRQRRRGFRLR